LNFPKTNQAFISFNLHFYVFVINVRPVIPFFSCQNDINVTSVPSPCVRRSFVDPSSILRRRFVLLFSCQSGNFISFHNGEQKLSLFKSFLNNIDNFSFCIYICMGGTRYTVRGTRNTKHGTRNTEHEARNTKHETRNTHIVHRDP
jgi:hypothetical protein